MAKKQITVNAPNIKWQFIEPDKANKYHLQLIEADSNNTLLLLNLRYIPSGMTISDFIEHIIKEGIVLDPSSIPVPPKE